MANMVGPELRRYCAAADAVEASRQRALNCLRLAARAVADAALSSQLAAAEAILAVPAAARPMGPVALMLGSVVAAWGKDAILTGMFGKDDEDPGSLADQVLDTAESVNDAAQKTQTLAEGLSNVEEFVSVDLGPVSDTIDAISTAKGAADELLEAQEAMGEHIRVAKELKEATGELEAAKAQLRPLLDLAHAAQDRQLLRLAEDFTAAAQLVEDTETDLGRYLVE